MFLHCLNSQNNRIDVIQFLLTSIILIYIYPYSVLFSAELLLEEKIEYNDLVKSIRDGNSTNDDEHSNVLTVQPDKQNDVASKNGNCKLKPKNSV